MALDLVNFQIKAKDAVKAFWGNREAARLKQIELVKSDQGERAGVTAGKNMDGFMALILEIIRANGLSHAQIHQQRKALTLPGYFRPTKLWDKAARLNVPPYSSPLVLFYHYFLDYSFAAR
jgi:type II restriction enzyme